MKKSIVRIGIAFITLAVPSCKEVAEKSNAVTGVTLNESSLSMMVGTDYTLIAVVEPADATNKDVKWESNKPTVATVDANGKVTAKTEGTAAIYVFTNDGGKMGKCDVTVYIPVTGIVLNKTKLEFDDIGKTEKLILSVIPANATNMTVSWSSDNETVATVASSGIVTSRGSGTANITVKTSDGGFEAACKVTVVRTTTRYSNPVIRSSVPDPTIIQVGDGSFYLYSTEDVRNLPIYHSYDLVNWTFTGTAFTNATRPTFEPNGGLWAPDINYINGKYVLYYAMSVWGGEWTCGIGVAVADRPEGPFTDLGKLFQSNEIGVQNSIDANYVEDGGKKFLFWGSFRGIYGIELTDDGLNLKNGLQTTKQQVAGTAFEAVYIHKQGKYYYIFASWGSCCNGLNSTYRTVVGRSENLWGPYTDKQGRSMMQNNYEIVIRENSAFVGVGNNSRIVRDRAGNDWILYHGYSVAIGTGRHLFLDKIVWVDDWPTILGYSPSIEADVPVF